MKFIRRLGNGVMFEPVDPYHIAGTYTMDWVQFLMSTDMVREANA